MAKVYLVNAFSINMLGTLEFAKAEFQKISKEEAKEVLTANEFTPAIGHEDLANVVKSDLGIDDNIYNKTTVTVNPWDLLVVAQYRGPRLPNGTTELPEGATIEYWTVLIRP